MALPFLCINIYKLKQVENNYNHDSYNRYTDE